MKRTSKKTNFFVKIFKFLDKLIITPITKFILTITDLVKNNGHGLEKVLTNRQALVIISLLAALMVFFAVDNKFVTMDNSAEVLYGQKVTAIYNEEAYDVVGIPETVDVTLIGRKWDVYLAKQYPVDEVIADLTGLSPGQHRVTLKYKQSVASVDYKLDTSNVIVNIYEKMSESRELTPDIIHKDKLDTKLNIENVTLNRNSVIIKGAEYKLNEVASVKALIDVDNIARQSIGTFTMSDIPLVAYNSAGEKVEVEIVPEKVEAVIQIASPSKVVPIKVIADGTPEGKAISSLTPSVTEVTIYGDSASLDSIEFLPVKIDVSNVTSNKTYTVNLTKPTGVREISIKTINIKLTLDEVTSKEISGVNIKTINLEPGYTVHALSAEDSVISVIVNGSSSVLDSIDASNISAYVDLKGLKTGEHEVEVSVTGDDSRLTYKSRVKKVRVVISR